jgi:hypothetical protein
MRLAGWDHQDDIVSKTISGALGGRRAVLLDSDDEECVALPSHSPSFFLPNSWQQESELSLISGKNRSFC